MHPGMQAPGIDQNGGVQRCYLDKPENERYGGTKTFIFFFLITLEMITFDYGSVFDGLLRNGFQTYA